MKKLFLGVTATFLSLLFTLSAGGCSCVGSSPLSFTNGFYGTSETKPGVGYSETLVYDVHNEEDYDQYLTKNPAIDDVLDFSYDGTYTVELKTKSYLDDSLPEQVKNSQVVKNVSESTGNCLVYEIVATLSYQSKYVINQVESTYNDYVIKKVYTCSSEHSFAPIYSTTESQFSIVRLSNDGVAQIEVQSYTDSVLYGNSSYQIKKSANGLENTNDVTYSFRYLIDNNQLFFAIRNLSLSKSSSLSLPTVSTTYEQTKNLVVKNEDEYQRDIELNVNGQTSTYNMPVRKISYVLDNGSLSGSNQFLIVQNGKVMDGETTLLDNFALPVEHASMICSYGTFIRMGALVYTLKSVNINK